jgi:hypothetical protein
MWNKLSAKWRSYTGLIEEVKNCFFSQTPAQRPRSRGDQAANRTQKHLVTEILQDSTSDRPASCTTTIPYSASMIENSPENCESFILKIKQLEENNAKLKICNQTLMQANRKLNVKRNVLLNKVRVLKGQVRL